MRLIRSVSLFALSVFVAGIAYGGYGSPDTVEAQLKFGADMAKRGLWSEAYFRFQRAALLEPRSPRVLNNLAVAAEALGRFEEALSTYRDGLELAPGSRELRGNYDRFLGFYEAYKARKTKGVTEEGAAQEAAEPASADADAAAADADVEPPSSPPSSEGSGDTSRGR